MRPGQGGDFTGRVSDQQGNPIAGARVEVAGQHTLTQRDGSFALSVRQVAQRYVLNISHPDFAEHSVITRTPLRGQNWPLVRVQIDVVDAASPIVLKDQRTELAAKKMDGAVFRLPANTLVDRGGNPVNGKVRAAIATLDVSNGEGPGDWAVRSNTGQEGYLISYGAVFIQFSNPNTNEPYQIRAGGHGQLSLPVIPSMRKYAPETPRAPFWYYDTKDGFWKGTGSSQFDKVTRAYVGDVNHLSTINTDIAKFDNAACMKFTLDPSVPTGLKLRIRYHSGGTPFGQTPTFVMSDTVNAAYRLPANTNVLIELLNASDEVFGNLVVEDPAGTPLVNTVVNTASPIPSGHTLWPPPPFGDCKPIVLRLATPEVEIRINESIGDELPKDNPGDDYITWAPTFCRARLTTPMPGNVNVVLTNDAASAIVDGGDVLFAAHQSPWPTNTTATQDTVSLTLPGNGSWVPFVVAGKFGNPSTNDKDAIIEAHQDTPSGSVLGTKALMVRVRKNANALKNSERDRFLHALQRMRNRGGMNYVLFQEMHRLATTAGDEAHRQPAFLPWHRAMLLHFERELQKFDPSVALHYWNWDAPAPNIFAPNFMGAANTAGSFIEEPIFAVGNPLLGWNTDTSFSSGRIMRSTEDHTQNPADVLPFTPLVNSVTPANSLVGKADFGPTTPGTATRVSFNDFVEERSHDLGHGFACTGGNLGLPNRSANDPMFYLLHSQIERQWAYWQWRNGRFGVVSGGGTTLTFPAPAHYDNNGNWNDLGVTTWQKGSFLEDGMWPWDGTTAGPSGRERRPVNQANGTDTTNEAISHPLIPTSLFPVSVFRNLWPASSVPARPKDMIDYLGKFRVQDGLGFCYDDVPYQ